MKIYTKQQKRSRKTRSKKVIISGLDKTKSKIDEMKVVIGNRQSKRMNRNRGD